MKQFISTKLFLALQEASLTGIDADSRELENKYEEFVMLLFSEKTAATDKITCYNRLVYTRVELASLTGIPEKKMQQFI